MKETSEQNKVKGREALLEKKNRNPVYRLVGAMRKQLDSQKNTAENSEDSDNINDTKQNRMDLKEKTDKTEETPKNNEVSYLGDLSELQEEIEQTKEEIKHKTSDKVVDDLEFIEKKEVEIPIESRAKEIVESFNKGKFPAFITYSTQEVLLAYGINQEDINNSKPEDLMGKLKNSFEEINAKETEALLGNLEEEGEKIEKEAEKRGVLNYVRKAGEWYKGQPLKYKMALVAGLTAGALLSGGVMTTVFAGFITGQRILGGTATFVALEGLLKQQAEKGGRERGKWEARRHTAEAAIAGALVGGGGISEASKIFDYWSPNEEVVIENIKNEIEKQFNPTSGNIPDEDLVGSVPADLEKGVLGVTGTEGLEEISHTIAKGDNLWNIIKDQLQLEGLNEAQQTYAIDSIKDRFTAMSPEQLKDLGFSNGNIDKINIGDKLNLNSILGNEAYTNEALTEASNLTQAQIAGIEASNNRMVEDLSSPERILEEVNLADGALDRVSEPLTLENSMEMANQSDLPLEVVAQQAETQMQTDLVEIYKPGFFSSLFGDSQVAQWEEVKNQLASGVVEAKNNLDNKAFGDMVGGATEPNNRIELQKYLKDLVTKSGLAIIKGENVEHYIKRALVFTMTKSS